MAIYGKMGLFEHLIQGTVHHSGKNPERRSLKQLVTSHPQSAIKEKMNECMPVLRSPFVPILYRAESPAQGMVLSIINMGLPCQLT